MQYLTVAFADNQNVLRNDPAISGKFVMIFKQQHVPADEGGVKHSFGPGEALFVPEGLMCNAKATEKVRLFFAILRPGQTEGD